MKKIKFYIITIIFTVLLGVFLYFVFDFSYRVKIIFSFIKEEDRKKIISNISEKVTSDIIKEKLESSLITFAKKIDKNSYSDEYLKELLTYFEKFSSSNIIDSSVVEEFSKKVNRDI